MVDPRYQYELIIEVQSLHDIELRNSSQESMNVIIMADNKVLHNFSKISNDDNDNTTNEEKSPSYQRERRLARVSLQHGEGNHFTVIKCARENKLKWKIPFHSNSDGSLSLHEFVKGSIKFYIFDVENYMEDLPVDNMNCDDAVGWGVLDLKCLLDSEVFGTILNESKLLYRTPLESSRSIKVYGSGMKSAMDLSILIVRADDKYEKEESKECNGDHNLPQVLTDIEQLSSLCDNDSFYITGYCRDNVNSSPIPFPPPILDCHFEFDDDTSTSKPVIKSNDMGDEDFLVNINVKSAFNLHLLGDSYSTVADKNGAWLSYSCFGMIIQSDRFFSLKYPSFVPLTDTFKIRTSITKISKISPLFIHVCLNEHVLGTAGVRYDICEQSMNENLKHKICGNFTVQRETNQISDRVDNGDFKPYISIEIMFEKQIRSDSKLDRGDKSFKYVRNDRNPINRTDSTMTVDCSSQETFDRYQMEQRHWEQWRQNQELEWSQKLRAKEDAVMRLLEKKAEEKEKELSRAMNNFQLEHGRLEQRLKKAIHDVELKERKLVNEDLKRKSDYDQKLADLQIKQHRMKSEANRVVEREKAKAQFNLDRIASLEEATRKAEERTRMLENELDEFHRRYRNSTEASLVQEVTTLKGKINDTNAALLHERAEKTKAVLDRDKYKCKMRQLTKALQREKNKKDAEVRHEAQKLRLEYLAQEQVFHLDGDKDVLRTIKEELRNLNSRNAFHQPKHLSINPFKPEVYPTLNSSQKDEVPRKYEPFPLSI